MEILTFPNYRQSRSYDCVILVIQAILVYYGIHIRRDAILKRARTTETGGTRPDDAVRIFKEEGLMVEARVMTPHDIRSFIDRDIPVMIYLQAHAEVSDTDYASSWTNGHSVAAIGYDKDTFIFEDPSTFYRASLTEKELLRRWHDKDLGGKEYKQFGIAVYGKDPVFHPDRIEPMP